MANGPGFTDTSSSAAPRVLPATPAKTPAGPAPARKAAPKPAVASKPAPAKRPAPKNNDPYGVQALVQAQVQPALQNLASEQNQTLAQQNQQRAAIQQATNEFLKYVTGQPSVQGDYGNAAAQEGGLGRSAAALLQGQNPGVDPMVAGLSHAQADQLAQQYGATFGQGAAALYGRGALIPGSELAENGAAAAAFQKSQAPNVALQGLKGLKEFAYGANQANQTLAQKRADILAQIPGLTAKTQASVASQQAANAYKDAQLGFEKSRLNLENTRVNNQATEFSLRQTQSSQQFSQRERQQQQQFISRQKQQAEIFNAKQSSTAQKQALPSASLSQKVGYLVDSAGNPIADARGRRQILPGFKQQNGVIVPRSKGTGTSASGVKLPTAGQINSFVTAWKNGKSTVQTVKGANPDANGNPVYKTIRTPTGKLNYTQAYKRLTTMGLDDKSARTYLDTAYQKGEQGRAWLTNEQQAALEKAGRQPSVGKYQGHAYIAVPQAQALKAAGLLPEGELVGKRYFIRPGY